MSRSSKIIRSILTAVPHIESVACAPDLTLWPRFLSLQEQHILLATALRQLDHRDTRRARRRMKEYKILNPSTKPPSLLHEQFLPDDYYDFQEGHFDGVIHHYREMHLNTWPEDEISGLSLILRRMYDMCPTNKVQTHLLHLASYGEILPHVDNPSASGSWIMGLSLGAERLLRMEGPIDKFDILLPSGSLYLQRDSMRYQYKHSILKGKLSDGQDPRIGQRLSIIIRDHPSSLNVRP